MTNQNKNQINGTAKPSSAANVSGCCGRQHTKLVIKDKIKRLENEIKSLKTILNNIDWDALTNEQETYLWDYFIKNC